MLLLDTSDDAALGTRRALVGCDGGNAEPQGTVNPRTESDDCLKAFQLIENIRLVVNSDRNGVGAILDDAALKLKLFMGHTLRCHVQHSVFDQSDRMLQEAEPETYAIITMDYKMKFDPKTFRAKMTDW